MVEIRPAGRHPLIFAGQVAHFPAGLKCGDLVAVRHIEWGHVGYGLWNPRAELRLRILSRGIDPPDDHWWNRRLEEAVDLRRDLLRLDRVTDTYRVIHAESDGLSGLVVDRYGPVLSAEVFAGAMRPRVDDLLKRLGERLGTEHTMVKAAPESQGREGFDFEPYASPGCPKQVVVREFGTRFRVRFSGGHKTGFFCDQRDNRRKLAEFTEGRSVLDVCCYTGGFAVQAATLGKAADVTAIDLDEEAIAVAKENANLNQARIRFAHSDAFGWMRDALRQGRMWDVVVLDPPKLIRSRAEYEEGHRKHHDLNRLAISLVRPGGLLLTCTCAGLMDRDEFQRVVHAAARRAEKAGSGAEVEATSFLEGDDGPAAFSPRIRGRSLRIFDVTAAAADHPVSPECPETRYLSAIWAQVGE